LSLFTEHNGSRKNKKKTLLNLTTIHFQQDDHFSTESETSCSFAVNFAVQLGISSFGNLKPN